MKCAARGKWVGVGVTFIDGFRGLLVGEGGGGLFF